MWFCVENSRTWIVNRVSYKDHVPQPDQNFCRFDNKVDLRKQIRSKMIKKTTYIMLKEYIDLKHLKRKRI